MKLSGAQIVIEQLYAHGVTTVFGYPGGSVLPIYDELYMNEDRITHIITAHEQGAVHAADGYARASGKTGVVIATSGPGATNLVTGIANAYLDSIPIIAITGNVSVPLLGKDSFQEVDIIGITQPVVKHSFEVRDISTLEHIMNEAFHIAGSGRKGPVLVDIPKSVQEAVYEYSGLQYELHNIEEPCDISEVIAAIVSSQKPYIYSGGGVISSGAEIELLELSKRISAPVGFSMMGLTALPNDYPLNLGMCGMHGRYVSSVISSECDLLLALGVRFSDRATGNTLSFVQDRVIVHIDIDKAEMGKNISPDIVVCGDLKKILRQLLNILPPMKNTDWLNHISKLKKEDSLVPSDLFTPRNIIEMIGSFCDGDTVIASDVGQHQMWTVQYYPFRKPRTLLTSGGLGAMGFGLGAAIGASIALEKRRTVLITGDGSFGMNLIELSTAVSFNLPIVIVILNNGVLGMVRQWQNIFYDSRYSMTTLNRKTDFVKVAEAFGAKGFSVNSLEELKETLKYLPVSVPVVIDCHIDMDEKVFPMIPPGGSFKEIIKG